jgi:hypothetical protein
MLSTFGRAFVAKPRGPQYGTTCMEITDAWSSEGAYADLSSGGHHIWAGAARS